MRRLPIIAALLLAGCRSEPSFDERFDKASQEVEARARAMDKDVAAADRAAALTGDGAKVAAAKQSLPAAADPPKAPPSSGE